MQYYKRPIRARDIFLAHHGVKGQKWGVQNGPPYPLDESISTGKSLRDTEEQQRKNYERLKVSGDPKKHVEEIIEESKGLRDLKKEITNSEAAKLAKDYKDHEEEYLDLVSQYVYERNNPYGASLDDIMYLYKYDDGDQGSVTSEAMYLADKGKFNSDAVNNGFDTMQKWDDACREVAKKALGKYGDMKIDPNNSWSNAKNDLESALSYVDSVWDTFGFVYNAVETNDSIIKDMQDWLKNTGKK